MEARGLRDVIVVQSNLACTYANLGRREEALLMRRDVYSGRLKLNGEEHLNTLQAASNYAVSLLSLPRFEEAKLLLQKTMPVARRVLGEGHKLTLLMRSNYAEALWRDPAATLDDLREAVTTLEDVARTARRVLGGAHPITAGVGRELLKARATLRARETPPPPGFA
jgi:hypothetical protein